MIVDVVIYLLIGDDNVALDTVADAVIYKVAVVLEVLGVVVIIFVVFVTAVELVVFMVVISVLGIIIVDIVVLILVVLVITEVSTVVPCEASRSAVVFLFFRAPESVYSHYIDQ